jgi:hypothetical protein
MIRVFCACGRAFKAEDRHAGKHTKCPECGADLTIGQVPKSSSSGGDVEDLPSWWYPSDSAGQIDRAVAPTQSRSDPDSKNTMVLPPANHAKDAPQGLGPGPSAGVPAGARVPVSKPPTTSDKKLWALAGGTAALAILAVGAILWIRSATPGGDAVLPAARRAELANTNDVNQSKISAPSAPRLEPKSSESPVANKSTTDSPISAPLPKTQVDVGAQSKTDFPVAGRRLRLLVPAYIYPVGEGRKEWQRLIDAASKVEIVAIANPSSGPGEESNLDYAAIFTEASSHGVTLVGYVSTDYGKRTKAEIKKDIDAWLRFYPQIHGFFLDQQPREGRSAPLYAELREYVKQKLHDPLVIGNPGIPCDAAYLAQSVSNVTCVFANFQGFSQFELPATLKAFDPSHFAALPYNIANVESMQAAVKDAIIKRIGYLYVSDAKPPNHWDKLPVYWEEEVDAVSRVR